MVLKIFFELKHDKYIKIHCNFKLGNIHTLSQALVDNVTLVIEVWKARHIMYVLSKRNKVNEREFYSGLMNCVISLIRSSYILHDNIY